MSIINECLDYDEFPKIIKQHIYIRKYIRLELRTAVVNENKHYLLTII